MYYWQLHKDFCANHNDFEVLSINPILDKINTLLFKSKSATCYIVSSFVHSSSINEHKNMKLSKHICYEMIN